MLAAAGLGLAALGACGGDDSSSDSDDYSVVGGLEQLPESTLDDGYLIQTADLATASDLSGLDRPDPDADFDEASDWLLHIDGAIQSDDEDAPTVSGLLPEAANRQELQQIDEFRDEVGWTVLGVDHYVEVSLPPDRFTVMAGDFDTDALDDALGEADDGVWTLGDGDDYEVSIEDRSAARPLGETLHLAEQDGRLAVSKSSRQIEDWVDGDGDTVAGDDAIHAVGAALDDQDVYAAMILDGEPLIADGDDALEPFDVLGLGLTLDDDQPRAVFVYHFGDEGDAEDAADGIEAAFEDGVSLRTAAPISDFFEDPEVTVDGATVTVVADLARDLAAGRIWQFAFTQDLITSHR